MRRTLTAISILVACVSFGSTGFAQDAPDGLDELPPIQTEEGDVIPPPPPEVPRMREPIRPIDATSTPPDPLVDVIPIPPTDNRYGGDDPANWRPKRNIYTSTGDVVLTGAAAGIALTTAIVPPQEAHVRGGVLFDEAARDALRLGDRNWRYRVRDASDVGASLLTTWPFLVDALLSAWWYRGDVKLARNMALVAAETLALSTAAQGVTNTIASRERPYGRTCGNDLPENTNDCEGNVRYRSFFSGHAAATFASAGILCWNHLGLRLLGGPWDAMTCVTGYALATTTALFRTMSDMHYASDITLGAIIGTSVGLVVPWMHLSPPITDDRPGRVHVKVAPVGQGFGLAGSF